MLIRRIKFLVILFLLISFALTMVACDTGYNTNGEESETYSLSLSVEGYGQIYINDEEINIDNDFKEVEAEEGIHDIEAIPGYNWKFKHWVGDVDDKDSAETTFKMDSDKSVTAHFEKQELAFFEVEITNYPEVIEEIGEVEVEYTVENTGNIGDSQVITFSVNGTEMDSEEITLDAEETYKSEFIYTTTSEDFGEEISIEVVSDDDSDSAKIIAIKIGDINEPDTFDLILEDEPDNGLLHFTLENIMDADQNIYTGRLIGENNILEIDYIDSKIKFYWLCTGDYLHRATLTLDDLGFNDNHFSNDLSTSFQLSNKFSDTIYVKNDKAYVKDEWFEFINMIHSFDKYEVILSFSYEGESIKVSSGKLDYLAFKEFPTGSAYRNIMIIVSDEEGNPIEGAEVLIWTETKKQYWQSPYFITDENGEYGGGQVRLASEDAHYITVEKVGYYFKNKNIKLGVGADHIRDGDGTRYPEPKIINVTLTEK